jgi:hypothetical protein
MNTNDIKTGYAKLMKAVAEDDFYKVDLSNRVNCYVCESCKHITKTKDVDSGVTPFMIHCEMCGGWAKSTMYRDIAPQQNPTFEWYRPSLEETISKNENNPQFDLEHVLRGGLLKREIKKIPTGVELIAAERQEQISKHGYTIKFDIKTNTECQLAYAAERLCVPELDIYNYQEPQGFSEELWNKLTSKPYMDRLIIAGALIAAEIDRLQGETE